MARLKFSWKWKVAAALVGFLVGAAAVVAINQGKSDNEAKRALAASIENDKKIEAARVERVGQINRINRAQCASLRNLYAIIQKTITVSDSNLDKIAYYRDHPAERARAHRQNRRTLELFRRPPCPHDIALPVKGKP